MLRPLLLAALCLASACQNLPPEDEVPASPDPAQLRTLMVERAYTLEDGRDEDFKARIATEAAMACGSAGHRVISTRPVGTEVIGEEFLFRPYEVVVACQG